jgi:hypothetical protein
LGIIIKHKKHYLTRLPLWFFVIVFIGLSPIIIGMLGAWISEATTGEPCHEGNCSWMVLPWFGFISIPLGALGLFFYFAIIVYDSVQLSRNKTNI